MLFCRAPDSSIASQPAAPGAKQRRASSSVTPCLRASGIIIINNHHHRRHFIITEDAKAWHLPFRSHWASSSSMCRDCATANAQTEGRGSRQQQRFSGCCTSRQAGPCIKPLRFSASCTRRHAEPCLTPGGGSRLQRRFSACWSGNATAHEQTEDGGSRQQQRLSACCTRRQAEPCIKPRRF